MGFAYCLFQLIACWEQIRENFHNGGCPYIVGPGLVYGVVDVAVDTAIFIIPMPLVSWDLSTGTRYNYIYRLLHCSCPGSEKLEYYLLC